VAVRDGGGLAGGGRGFGRRRGIGMGPRAEVTGRETRRMPWSRRIQWRKCARERPQFLQHFYAFVTELL
jgi:hypothetical protein